jgi:hypothetical protein
MPLASRHPDAGVGNLVGSVDPDQGKSQALCDHRSWTRSTEAEHKLQTDPQTGLSVPFLALI